MAKRRGRGEGSIQQLPSGSYRAALTVRTVGGRKDRLTETFPTRSEAAAWLAEQRTKFRFGKLAVTTLTLGEYLDQWLRRRVPTVQPGTADYYTRQVARLKGFPVAAEPLRRLTRALIEGAVPGWGKVDQQRKALDVLRIVLNDAVEDGLVPANAASKARKPVAGARRLGYWTADEARKLLAAAAGQYLEAYFWVALDAGLRPGELLALHWPDVDLTAGTVKVSRSLEDIGGELRLKEPKTRKGVRTLRVCDHTIRALLEHRERMAGKGRDVAAGPVFVGRRTGKLITYTVFYQKYYLPVVRAAAGVPVHRPYATRHTCATLLLAAGVSIKVVSERLGHEDINTTLKHYIHCLPDAQEAAARAAGDILGGGRSATRQEGPAGVYREVWSTAPSSPDVAGSTTDLTGPG